MFFLVFILGKSVINFFINYDNLDRKHYQCHQPKKGNARHSKQKAFVGKNLLTS